MKDTTKRIAGVGGSAILLASMGTMAVSTIAPPSASAAQEGGNEYVVDAEGVNTLQTASTVEGDFAFSQDIVSSTDQIAKAIKDGSAYLCGAQAASDSVALGEWNIAIKGDVGHPVVASMEELSEKGEVLGMTMSCICSGNPVDGAASVNAAIKGVTIQSLMKMCQPEADVNTVVFATSDGYEVALPLAYVAQRSSLIVFDVNGSPLADTVGGTNQLWLGATSARYFARDITAVTFESRVTPPPAPGSKEANDAYANVPNISVSNASVSL